MAERRSHCLEVFRPSRLDGRRSGWPVVEPALPSWLCSARAGSEAPLVGVVGRAWGHMCVCIGRRGKRRRGWMKRSCLKNFLDHLST